MTEGRPYAKLRRQRPGRSAWVWSGNVVVPGRGRWTCRHDHDSREWAVRCAERMLARALAREEGC